MNTGGSLAASTETALLAGTPRRPLRMSATMLGGKLGLSPRDMNLLLHELGFLYGRPGAWGLTEKGKLFGLELDHTNGYGGCAERWWSTTSWDPKILDAVEHELAERATTAGTLVREAVATLGLSTAASPAATEAVPVASTASQARRNLLVAAGVTVAVVVVAVAYPHAKRWVRNKRNRRSGGHGADSAQQ